MTLAEFEKWYQKLEDDAIKLFTNKGRDYCGGTDDRFANMKRLAKLNPRMRAIDICHMFLHKHLDAINTFVATDRLDGGEEIRSRIIDARNFLALLGAMVSELGEKVNPVVSQFNEWKCYKCKAQGPIVGGDPYLDNNACPKCYHTGLVYSIRTEEEKKYGYQCGWCQHVNSEITVACGSCGGKKGTSMKDRELA